MSTDGNFARFLVGDAAMHPAELLEANGNIDPRRMSATPSVQWLHRLATHFDRSVWINPEQPGSGNSRKRRAPSASSSRCST
jgi:uncharacterized protein with von Willebrand factor type A (vWA) domain